MCIILHPPLPTVVSNQKANPVLRPSLAPDGRVGRFEIPVIRGI